MWCSSGRIFVAPRRDRAISQIMPQLLSQRPVHGGLEHRPLGHRPLESGRVVVNEALILVLSRH
jgi:hypothetical protein